VLELAGALVPGLPLAAAAWIAAGWAAGLNRGEAGERATARVAVAAAAGSLILLLGLGLLAAVRGAPGQVVLARWLASGEYQVGLSLTLDPLALSAATLAALLCLLALRFSTHYMHREPGFQRFFAVMSLFTAGVLLLVTAGNAVLAFVGWELAGVSSYLLIGYVYDRPTATGNALRALVANRIGDAGLMLGIALAFLWTGGVEWPALFAAGERLETLTAGALAAGFLLAALAKSAQVPFAPWLGRALEGPTPSSAVFYGAVMVHAGVYLVLRLEPLLIEAPALLHTMVVLGGLTAIYGYLGGLVQADVKSALTFSVSAQVGLMFLACGLGYFELAAWHMAAHAGWRAYQFLSAPGYLHLVSRPARPAPAWLARRRTLFAAAVRRFWLDPAADALLVAPTRRLASEARALDERVINRVVGLPEQTGTLSSLAEWETRGPGALGVEGEIARARGVAGHSLEWLARTLAWVEDRLVMKHGAQGATRALRHMGSYLLRVEELLSQPRYLLLLIAATFVVIL
jgi:NADH:ubiquinone oxidoreductase subunit 5 (subunit L)/multisubunit Na+/H+ antiporter MnhA subunit